MITVLPHTGENGEYGTGNDGITSDNDWIDVSHAVRSGEQRIAVGFDGWFGELDLERSRGEQSHLCGDGHGCGSVRELDGVIAGGFVGGGVGLHRCEWSATDQRSRRGECNQQSELGTGSA